MSDSMFLTHEELVELTDRTQHAALARALRSLGIEHKVRADGHVKVLREHVRKQFGVNVSKDDAPAEAFDWSAA